MEEGIAGGNCAVGGSSSGHCFTVDGHRFVNHAATEYIRKTSSHSDAKWRGGSDCSSSRAASSLLRRKKVNALRTLSDFLRRTTVTHDSVVGVSQKRLPLSQML